MPRQSHGRNLDTDLAALQPPVQLSSGVPIRYWRPDAGQLDDAGRVRPPAQALCAVTAHDVRTRTLPDDVLAAGITIDPDYRRPPGLNEVVRVRTPAGTHLYLKIEENSAAARAELLASLLWHRMGWPGIGERVLLSDDRQVLIIPPVGGVGGIDDWGNFNQAFAGYSLEQDGVTLDAERAGAIRRVPLHVLNLDDPDDVLRFVTMNAGWGNTDRHVNNVHFGWRTDPAAPEGGHGYLLPLDHGRCFFNNDPNRAGQRINGSPAAAVTGRISNPHQLLRAFADRAAVDPDEAAAVVAFWARAVRAVVSELAKDPEWGAYAAELGAMGSRLGAIAADPAGFVTACRKVVLP